MIVRLTSLIAIPKRVGAGEGNRTLVCSLGSCRSAIELRPQFPILSLISKMNWHFFGMKLFARKSINPPEHTQTTLRSQRAVTAPDLRVAGPPPPALASSSTLSSIFHLLFDL